jgi:hypothetical protein
MCLTINIEKAIADTGHYSITPSTGAITPEESSKIALKRVKVIINANKLDSSIVANCEFDFVNETAERQDVLMGFPVANVEGSGNLGIAGLSDFRIKVGKINPQLALYPEPFIDPKTGERKEFLSNALYNFKLINTDKLNPKFHGIETLLPKVKTTFGFEIITTVYWRYVFDPYESQRITVEYNADVWDHIKYIIGTAGLWAGPVGVMDVSILYSDKIPYHLISALPATYEYAGNSLHWHFENYKPSKTDEAITVNVASLKGHYDSSKWPKDAFMTRRANPQQSELSSQYVRYYPFFGPLEFSGDPQEQRDGVYKSPKYVVDEVSLLRNEIFARHGYMFKTPKYIDYFQKQPWYRKNPKYSDTDLNYIEKRNVSYLKCAEDAANHAPKELQSYFDSTGGLRAGLYSHSDEDDDTGETTISDRKLSKILDSYVDEIARCYFKYLP